MNGKVLIDKSLCTFAWIDNVLTSGFTVSSFLHPFTIEWSSDECSGSVLPFVAQERRVL